MFFTVFYAAATWVQSWRLGSLKTKIVQLTAQNGSVVLYKVPEIITDSEGGVSVQVPSVSSQLCENGEVAKLGDLLWSVGNKRFCSIFPKQTVCASRWIGFSSDGGQFPLPVQNLCELSEDRIHVLLETDVQQDSSQQISEFCQLSKFGLLKAWRAGGSVLGVLLESDAEHLTSLGLNFMQSPLLAVDDGMQLLRIQTVDVNGAPSQLLNADSIPAPRSLQQPWTPQDQEDVAGIVQPPPSWLLMSPVQWRSHVELLNSFSEAVQNAEDSTGLVMEADRSPALVPLPAEVECEKTTEPPVIVETAPQEVSQMKSGITSHSDSFYSCASQDMGKLSESLEQLSRALESIADENVNGEEEVKVEEEEKKEEPSELPAMKATPSKSLSKTPASLRSSTASLPVSPTPRSRSPSSPVRHPNVLVFSDSGHAEEHVRLLLKQILRKYRYTVYSVNAEQLKGSGWQPSSALVVVCGSVPDTLASALVSYLLAGGKLLCLCSDLLHLVLPEFRTAEVRANELVAFSYHKWKKVKMLHHVFCYQQSPVHSKFGAVSEQKGLTPSTAVELKDREGEMHTLSVSVLGVEETWHTPSLILASAPGAGGKILFSQVHLEVDPLQYANDNATYASLKQSNATRLEIMRDILGRVLGLECSETGAKDETPTTGYFLGKHELKVELLNSLKSRMDGNSLKLDSLKIQFCGKGDSPGPPSSSLLPVLLYTCPPHFNTLDYFDNLSSNELGRLVVYADVMKSSSDVLAGAPLINGIAAVPRLQLNGKGRGGNEWLSPEGCAMFTLQLLLPLHSNLGQRVSLIQHVAALAVVMAVREAPGYQDVDLRLKWPNDIYAGDWAKIGGILVTSSIMSNTICCNIGCGVNLNNSEPTTCLSELIGSAAPMSLEKFLALTFSRLESLVDLAQSSEQGLQEVLQVYYNYWLHGGAEVTILSDDGSKQRVTITGLDDYGFLLVRGVDGRSFSVHPDGNSFDMLQGLIKPKI